MKRYFGYSLVELLTVIVIASILLAIAVPAVSSMIRGSASTQAGRELMGRIRAAKAYAVSRQTPVAIVFYTRELPNGVSKFSPDYAFSAYRICSVKYDEKPMKNSERGCWVFQNWVSEWYFLPKGIAIGLQEEMTTSLPGELSDKAFKDPENANSLIRIIGDNNGNDPTVAKFFEVGAAGSGVSPVYNCDLSDIYDDPDPVVFRNAIVFNANGQMEKPKNISLNDSETSLQPDKAVVIPLRTAVIDSVSVSFEGESKDYIPVRIDPSGKTYFYDGYVSY